MSDIGKIIEAWERCKVCNMSLLATPEGRKAYLDCEYTIGMYCNNDKLVNQTIDLLKELKEQETKLICNLLGGQPYEVYCRECRTILCVLGKGETMNDVKSIFNYCPHCGRSVKW